MPDSRADEILRRLGEIRVLLQEVGPALMEERNRLFAEGQALEPKLTQKAMAQVAGVSDVTVTYALKALRDGDEVAAAG